MATGLTRWRPFAELEDLRDHIERIFSEMENGETRKRRIALDVIERDDRYCCAPTCRALSRTTSRSRSRMVCNVTEREAKGVTADQVEATCKDGVVDVSFPKPVKEERRAVTITPVTITPKGS